VLSHEDKRRIYDQFGHAGSGPGDGRGFKTLGHLQPFNDIFGDFFATSSTGATATGGAPGAGPSRGDDLRYDLESPWPKRGRHQDRRLDLDIAVPCEACKGTGAKAGDRPRDLRALRGAGRSASPRASFVLTTTCPDCQDRAGCEGALQRLPRQGSGAQGAPR